MKKIIYFLFLLFSSCQLAAQPPSQWKTIDTICKRCPAKDSTSWVNERWHTYDTLAIDTLMLYFRHRINRVTGVRQVQTRLVHKLPPVMPKPYQYWVDSLKKQ
jgi:hypothetical protein